MGQGDCGDDARVLADLVNVAERVELDAGLPRAEVAARDAALREALRVEAKCPARQLGRWAEQAGEAQAGERVASAAWTVSVALVVLGLVLGAGVASAVFAYDGTHPVNVTRVLWLFVGVQGVLLGLLGLALLPRRVTRAVPPLDAVVRVVSAVNLGALWPIAARVLPSETREALQRVLGRGERFRKLHGRVVRWQVLRWSQAAALSFQLGVAGAFFGLVTLQDVAFGWSTTLDVSDEGFAALVQGLASPWGWAWSDAVPGEALVQATRYTRLEGGRFAGEGSGEAVDQAVGLWWPFVMAVLLVYGVLPRLVTWGVCVWRMRQAVGWAVVHVPGVVGPGGVLERLNGEAVRLGEASDDAGDGSVLGSAAVPERGLPSAGQAVIDWAEPPTPEGAVLNGLGVAWRGAAGGARSVLDDEQAVADATAAVAGGEASGVVLRVKAWEPPMAETVDVLRALRARSGDGVVLTVWPVDEAGALAESPSWARALAGLGDPWLVLAEGDWA